MFFSIIQFSYFLELMLSSWSVSVLLSSSLLLIPPLGTGAPQKNCFSKCVSCHILRHSFCPSITKRVLCLSSFTVQDCQAAASLRLCLSPVLLNDFPDSLLILSLIDSPRINRLSKVNELINKQISSANCDILAQTVRMYSRDLAKQYRILLLLLVKHQN